jgi:beta-glucosidase
VILSVGEFWNSSGEAKSKSNIHLPGVQEDLIKVIQATGKPLVVLVNAGRPLIFNWTSENVPAILYTWWLGSEAGNAIADVLFGDYNPSGKLPMTFPRDEGQIPIYYNQLNTGRPAQNEPVTSYASGYTDIKNSPLYAFGHGLSYTTFSYTDLKISNHKMKMNQEIIVTLKVTNSGKVAGEEVVQLYLRDKVASVVRPIMELKDFQKISLNPRETKTVTFIIDNQKLSFYNQKLDYISEPGNFELMIGSSSNDIRCKDTFELLK